MQSRTRAPIPTFAAAAAWLVVGGATAQDAPVIHEYFEYAIPGPPPTGGDTRGLPRPGLVGPGGVPPADAGGDPFVLAPGGPIPGPGTFGDDAGGLRNGAGTPEAEVGFDTDTGPEGWLHYHAVFDPTVAPWKRAVARDGVRWQDEQAIVVNASPDESPISVAGAPPDGYVTFIGRLVVLADADQRTPIPSVAPDMLVHRIVVEPPAAPILTRDGAGNYFLRLDATGRHEITVDVSAPAFYFGGPIPETGAGRPAPRVAPALAASARPVIEAAGVTPEMTELQAAAALTRYFRAFEPAPLPPELRTGDVYQDVALAQVGVCRHRALGFVVTAAALGLAARYVHNEAHAFVEVHFTGLGWRRVDLGGGAAGMTTSGVAARPHVPGADPFGSSDTVDAWADALGAVEEQASEVPEPGARADDQDAPPGVPTGSGRPTSGSPSGSPDGGPSTTPPTSPGRDEHRGTPTLILDAPSRAYRGESVVATGALRDPTGAPLAARAVTVGLVRDGVPTQVLGTAETAPDGTFRAEVRLPSSLPVGSWEIVATFAGDSTWQPAVSP